MVTPPISLLISFRPITHPTPRQYYKFPSLKTRLVDEDNVVSAANKTRRMLFNLKRSFAALTPSIFLRLYKFFIQPHLEYAIQATHPVLFRDTEALEKVQKLTLKFVKGLR